jgi:hypothetical protein
LLALPAAVDDAGSETGVGSAMSGALKWTLGMTAIGLVTAVIVFAITGSVLWALVSLIGSGIVVNTVFHPPRGSR